LRISQIKAAKIQNFLFANDKMYIKCNLAYINNYDNNISILRSKCAIYQYSLTGYPSKRLPHQYSA